MAGSATCKLQEKEVRSGLAADHRSCKTVVFSMRCGSPATGLKKYEFPLTKCFQLRFVTISCRIAGGMFPFRVLRRGPVKVNSSSAFRVALLAASSLSAVAIASPASAQEIPDPVATASPVEKLDI